MLEIDQNFIATLKADAQITAIVPAANILTGPVDLLSKGTTDLELVLPAIVLWTVSEAQRPVPTNTRDTQVQLDVYSKTSQLELETVYERIIALLSQLTYNQGPAHIFWQLLAGGRDVIETDRRIWHKGVTFQVWAIKDY